MHLEEKVSPMVEREKKLHGNYNIQNEDDSDEEQEKTQDLNDENIPFWEDLRMNTTQQLTSTFNNEAAGKD